MHEDLSTQMNEAEIKTCQSCQTEFVIAPEDFAFYHKIDVPPPTWCPDCRYLRRMSFRNERHVLRKTDAHSGQTIFSSFSEASPIKVYATDYWYSDQWDAMDYARDYDFARPFFEQMQEFMHRVPLPARSVLNLENSEYSLNLSGARNTYMVRAAARTEDSAYLVFDNHSRNCFDCHMTSNCELCYGSVGLSDCYQVHFSVHCENSRNLWLCRDLVGCSDCFGCSNLRNKQYYIWNKPYTKEEYEAKLAALSLGSYKELMQLRSQAQTFWEQSPYKFMEGSGNEDSSGEYLYDSKNLIACYRVRGGEDSKYCQNILSGPEKDCYDHSNFGLGVELCYELLQSGEQVYNTRFSINCFNQNRNVQYSVFCHSSSNLFACIGLRSKQYCIFNKQYTQEEYEALVPKIIEQMNALPYTDKLGRVYRYGEFFPPELSGVEYNLTTAHDDRPLTKDEVLAQGLCWYEFSTQTVSAELSADSLPDSIKDVSSDLVRKVLSCAHTGQRAEQCTSVFTIIPQELAFLIEQGLPLPRLCPNCRHAERMGYRRSALFVTRQCQCAGARSSNGVYINTGSEHRSHPADVSCPNTFQTSFSPDRPEIVYCEACYQQELL